MTQPLSFIKIFSCMFIFIFLYVNDGHSAKTTILNSKGKVQSMATVEMCGSEKEFSIAKSRRVLVRSPMYGTGKQYPPNLKCSLYISGDKSCQVKVICYKFDFRPKECKKEYLKVLNGLEDFRTPAKLCGSHMIREPYKAALDLDEAQNNGLRFDLRTSTNETFRRVYNGFECDVSCVQD